MSELGEQVSELTVAQLSEKHEAANPPLEIIIQKDGFEAELRRMIRRPRGKILQEDYDLVGDVEASSVNGETADIKDIRFVEKLRNLTRFGLVDQPISDLRPLVNCQKIRDVYFFELKNITSIQVLENLPNLEILVLDKMQNWKRPEQTLAKLTQLKNLRFSHGNKLKDWSFIQNLKNLESMTLNPDGDFQTISRLKNLNLLMVMCDGSSGNQLPNLDQFNNFQHLKNWKYSSTIPNETSPTTTSTNCGRCCPIPRWWLEEVNPAVRLKADNLFVKPFGNRTEYRLGYALGIHINLISSLMETTLF